MQTLSLRKLVNAAAIAVAAVSGLAPPLGYLAVSYQGEAKLLAFKAQLNAGRIARYVYTHGDMWPYHNVRLTDIVAFDAASDMQVAQRVYQSAGPAVLEVGGALRTPTIMRSEPIVVGDATVGRIEIESSLSPFVDVAGLIALFSSALGFAAYFAVRILPLRALDRTLAQLRVANDTVRQANEELEVRNEKLLRHQDALNEQNARFSAALDNMSHGLAMFDREQHLIICNRRYAEIYQFPPELCRPGTPLREFIRFRMAFYEPVEEAKIDAFMAERYREILAGRPSNHKATIKNGTVVAITYQPMASGGWVVVHEDVTDRERAEQQRAVALEEAEQARRMEQEAAAANRAKSAFLATMSHEIRTPMNAVLGLAATLLEGDLAGDQRKAVRAIHESGDDLLRLLDDILDISKLEAGKLDLDPHPFAPVTMIDNVASIFEPRAAAKRLALRADVAPDVPMALTGDAARIRQVLMNLVSNAIKFTVQGEVVISARMLSSTDGHATVEWSVRDSGIGIRADRIARLFSEFVQADSSIARQYGGTGLGLAICRRLVELMAGRIEAASTPGGGSTFRFTLTLPTANLSALSQRSAETAADNLRAELVRLGRPLEILIAEDNPTNQFVVLSMLKEFDIKPAVANNGAEAVDLAERGAFDLVFMDVRMPEVDGLTATSAIRARGGPLAKVPIVGLSANAFNDDVQACRRAGMTDFVAKPVRKIKLIDAIVRSLHEASPPAAAPRAAAAAAADSEAPLIDREAFAEFLEEIGHDSARQVLAAFAIDIERRLRLFGEGTDKPLIEIEAHALKGAAATVGLRELQRLASLLERNAATLAAPAYRDLVAQIEDAARRTKAALDAAMTAAVA